jgi:hypothetical protein
MDDVKRRNVGDSEIKKQNVFIDKLLRQINFYTNSSFNLASHVHRSD